MQLSYMNTTSFLMCDTHAPLEIWYCSYLTIGWNFSVLCRPITNLMECAYRLKCSPSAHIKKNF